MLLVAVMAALSAVAAAPVADAHTVHSTVARARAGCSWKPVGVTGGFQLHAVSAVSGSDIWAVGNANGVGKPFAVHYNGSQWTAVPMPTKGAGTIDLYDVDAFSKTNAWAVGSYVTTQGHRRTLTEHWNGTAWRIIDSPNRGIGDNSLHGVAAVNGTHAWAVGYMVPAGGEQHPLIEHWNGSSWRLFPPAGQGGMSHYLNDVAVISASNVVAVGHRRSRLEGRSSSASSGSAWQVEPNDDPLSSRGSELWAVSAPSAGAQWAVGEIINQQEHVRTLAERNVGGGWVLEAPANVGTAPNELKGVSALSAAKAFAVGNYMTSGGTRRALAELFANGSWTTFKPPNATQFDNELESVAAISPSNVWAVGYSAKDAHGHTLQPLIEHFHC